MQTTAENDISHQGRLHDELIVLEAIYAEQIKWLERNREVVYMSEDGEAKLVIRLPHDYLSASLPEVISASCRKSDLREQVRGWLAGRDPTVEQLDGLVEEFRSLVEVESAAIAEADERLHEGHDKVGDDADATVVVWLHHLLNTNKRKQVLSPASSAVSGYSKPGYPGVLLFTGRAAEVQSHVQELRDLNWQAFQVRLESDMRWDLPHSGVVEVENMGEIVSGLAEPYRQAFLSAVMKI